MANEGFVDACYPHHAHKLHKLRQMRVGDRLKPGRNTLAYNPARCLLKLFFYFSTLINF